MTLSSGSNENPSLEGITLKPCSDGATVNEYFPLASVVAVSTTPGGLIRTTTTLVRGLLPESLIWPEIVTVARFSVLTINGSLRVVSVSFSAGGAAGVAAVSGGGAEEDVDEPSTALVTGTDDVVVGVVVGIVVRLLCDEAAGAGTLAVWFRTSLRTDDCKSAAATSAVDLPVEFFDYYAPDRIRCTGIIAFDVTGQCFLFFALTLKRSTEMPLGSARCRSALGKYVDRTL